jgi:hypothetical protein
MVGAEDALAIGQALLVQGGGGVEGAELLADRG